MPQPTGQAMQVVAVCSTRCVAHIGAAPVDQCAGGADLQARAARDAGGLAKRHVGVGDDHRPRAAFADAQRVVGRDLVARPHAAAAQDAAAVVHEEVLARGVHRPALAWYSGRNFQWSGRSDRPAPAARSRCPLRCRSWRSTCSSDCARRRAAPARTCGPQRTFSDSVLTTMPSVTGKVQAGWRLRCFSISTRHMRQDPWGVRAG